LTRLDASLILLSVVSVDLGYARITYGDGLALSRA